MESHKGYYNLMEIIDEQVEYADSNYFMHSGCFWEINEHYLKIDAVVAI